MGSLARVLGGCRSSGRHLLQAQGLSQLGSKAGAVRAAQQQLKHLSRGFASAGALSMILMLCQPAWCMQ